jgi:hypothetical protein
MLSELLPKRTMDKDRDMQNWMTRKYST